MLIVKSKYKIAKRLGAGVFDKTQTQKFALSEARAKGGKPRGGRRGGSDFGRQLLEKQKVRFTYGISEKKLSAYVDEATHAEKPSVALFQQLEMRIDNAIYRAGLSQTRRSARQAVSHGHILINGKRTTTPSQMVKSGDTLAVRDGSRMSPLYASLAEKAADQSRAIPKWIDSDMSTLIAKITSEPSYSTIETGLDFPTVLEFYSR